MWGGWHDFVQGKSLNMFKKNPDGSYGEQRACCNLYHYKIKEIAGDDIQ